MIFRFLVRAFAIIGLLFVLLIGIGIWVGASYRPKPPQVADVTVLQFDFDKPVTEQAEVPPWNQLFGADGTTLTRTLDALRRGGDDPRVKGLVARGGNGRIGIARIQELRDAIKPFRAKGTVAIAFA